MKKPITSFDSLQRLFDAFEPEFIGHLIAVIWRVIAAVQSFFPIRDHPLQHRQVRAAIGTSRSGIGSLDYATNHPEDRIG